MSDCFSCGLSFGSDENLVLKRFKELYEQHSIVTYFYRLNKTDDLKIAYEDSFRYIFEKDIKPNIKKGANYAHISEFR